MVKALLLSVDYDGSLKKAFLKFYNEERGEIFKFYDPLGHKPYCLSDLDPERIKGLVEASGVNLPVVKIKKVRKKDLLRDREVHMSKVEVDDPLWISGRKNCLREALNSYGKDRHAWEAKIKYRNNYIYDLQLIPGEYYEIDEKEGIRHIDSKKRKLEELNVFRDEALLDPCLHSEIAKWLKLFSTPIPDIKRVSLDIEVYSPQKGRIPYAEKPVYPVISAAFVDNRGFKEVLILRREAVNEGDLKKVKEKADVRYFDSEIEMLRQIFVKIKEIPVLLTFNGDNFDLPYLMNRALRLGIRKEQIPIRQGKDWFKIDPGVHIDLYKFFHNKSIQIYAFRDAYKNVTLDEVAKALLKKGKIELEEEISVLTLEKLAIYCLRDAELTMELTTFNENLVLNLVILISKISKLGVEDVTRRGISAWIRSMLDFEHRGKGYLIPLPEEIIAEKGEATTTSIIKGKKYKGAIIIPPEEGVHFGITVLDFSSLYPSVIKSRNLSYETINCRHVECKRNKVPDTPHWVCLKRRGLLSVIIGALRDIRVKLYKPRSKDESISKKERERYMVIQQALKVILNASYGVLGAENFSYYCPPVAESVTAIGRHLIREVTRKAEEMGIQVVYGDTDSVFLKNPADEQIKELKAWAEKKLKVDMDIEKVYRYVALSNRKKNYLGVYPDGRVDIKGLIGKKKNTPEFIKQAFNEMVNILGQVKSQKDFEDARIRIEKIVKDRYTALRNRTFNLEDLTFKVVLSKPLDKYIKTTPQHVKAAKQLLKNRRKIGPGDTIEFVKTRNAAGVKPLELAKKGEIDVEKYIETLQSTFQQILDALNIDFEHIAGITSISDFL